MPSRRSPVCDSSQSITSASSEGPTTPPQPYATPAATISSEIGTRSPSPTKNVRPKAADMPHIETTQASRFPRRFESQSQNGIETTPATTKNAGTTPIRSGRPTMYSITNGASMPSTPAPMFTRKMASSSSRACGLRATSASARSGAVAPRP